MPGEPRGQRGKYVGLALAAVSGARDPWTGSTRPTTPSPPQRLVGCQRGPGDLGVLQRAEGERCEGRASSRTPPLARAALPHPHPGPGILPLLGADLAAAARGYLACSGYPGPRSTVSAPRVARKRV